VPKSLLIVGASVRAAAWSAVLSGIKPLAADRFADVDLDEMCCATRVDNYPEGLLSFFHSAPRYGWMYTGGLENDPGLVARLAALRPLFGNPPAVLREVRDPHHLAAALLERRLPQLAVRAGTDDVLRDGSWMRKSRRSTGGLGVAVWNGQGPGADWSGGETFFQQRMWGRPVAGLFVAAGRQCRLLGVTGQLIGSPWAGGSGFRYVGSVGPLDLPAKVVDQFRQVGNALTDRFGLVGLFGVDAILRDGQVWTVEVNPRYTASVEILERALGIRGVAIHLAACHGQQVPPAPDRRPTVGWGKAILFARRHVKVPAILTHKRTRQASAGGYPRLADVPWPGESIRRGAPIATVFACGANRRTIVRRLRTGLAEIEQQLGTYQPASRVIRLTGKTISAGMGRYRYCIR
jgi:predicted ATP-grasp superfamily ATP-dependent carboligase